MNSKWRAPACYVGVGILCALYLSIVPGIRFTDVCAGAGLGAAVMWAINEWETGKWNVPLPVQPALAAAFAQPLAQPALAGDAAAFQAMAPAAAVAPPPAAAMAPPPAESVAPPPALPDPEPRERVDAGAATPEKMEKWEIDEKEASWDPTALAETWAKLRAELSINRPQRPAVAPDLPRTAQLARNAPAARPITSTSGLKPAASGAAASQTSYTLGSLGKAGGSPVLNRLAGSSPSQPPVRKVASAAPEPARQPPAFLRPGTFRPR